MQQPPTPSSARHDTPIELPLPPSTLVGLAVGILAVALIAFLTYQALAIREVAAARISSAQETITQLETLLSSLKDAETAQRGYLLTGAERYLEPYTDARAAIPGEIARLRSLIIDAAQTQRLDSLEQLAQVKLAELAETVETRRGGDVARALALVTSDRGKTLMDRLRTLTAEMEAEERTILVQRQNDFRRAVTLSTWATWGGSAVLTLLMHWPRSSCRAISARARRRPGFAPARRASRSPAGRTAPRHARRKRADVSGRLPGRPGRRGFRRGRRTAASGASPTYATA